MNNHIDFEDKPFLLDKKKKPLTKRLMLIYATIIVMMLLLVGSWATANRRKVMELYQKISEKEQEFKVYQQMNGGVVALQEQKILELTKENMSLVKTVNDFKNIKSQVKIYTNTVIKEVKVPYAVEVIKYIDTHTNDVYVKLPLPLERNDSFFSIKATVGVDGLEIDSLSLPNELTITTGKMKRGFFKKDKYMVEVASSNPYVEIKKLNNVEFTPKKPFYKKWWFSFGLGAIATAIILQ